MSDILLRVHLHNPQQAHAELAQRAWPWVKDQTGQGRALCAEFRLLDDVITNEQRGYLHGVVLRDIAAFARPGGVQHDMKTWKEYFRSTWLGFKVVTSIDPFTLKKSRRRVRVSTEDLGVRKLAEYIDRIIAFAATDLGVEVSEPMPKHLRPAKGGAKRAETVDQDTGEIMEVAA